MVSEQSEGGEEIKCLSNGQKFETLLLKDEDGWLISMYGVNGGDTSSANLGNPDF